MKRFLFVFLAVLVIVAPQLSMQAAAAPSDSNCLFFTETGGDQGGFAVCDDESARFRAAYERWGLQKIGYPISQRYLHDGFVTQAFQKAIMQWRPETQSVALVNIFDDLNRAGLDEKLLETRQTPRQFPAGWDGELTFEEIVAKRQALLNERPALRRVYFSSSDPLTFFGLPTSEVEDMGNHYAIRLQRAVLQEWKEDVPWAKAGEVTIANGGDLAKEAGALPATALVPVAQVADTPAPDPAATQPATEEAPAAETPAPAPATSDAKGKILFTSNRESWDDIYVMNADGTGVKRLTTMGQAYDARFSPDGQTIVFEHGEDIWKMNADGSGQVNLTNTPDNGEGFPVVSPDGKKIAYLFAWAGGFEIYTMNLDGSDRKPITSRALDLMPMWSPDGSQLAFISLRNGTFNIWAVNQDGSGLRQVTHFGGERIVISPVFSPDGKQLAFTTLAEGTSWEIWVVNLDGSNAHKVVGAIGKDQNNSTSIIAWKDGKFLIGGYQGNWDPYFVSESGGEPARVISDPLDDKPSDWWTP